MRVHGDHWRALYAPNTDLFDVLERDCQEGLQVCSAPCRVVGDSTERDEEVICLQRGTSSIADQVLVVSDSTEGKHYVSTAYPVALDGIVHRLTVREVEPWAGRADCIEGWIHASVTSEQVALSVFDTMFFAGSASMQPGDVVDYVLAGLAYSLAPASTTSVSLKEGVLWDIMRQERIQDGESPEEADRPFEISLAGAAIFLPRDADDCDEAEFQGTIEAIERLEHDGQTVYRLEMVLMRPGNDEFRLPVFAAQHVMNAYVPQVGDDVAGVLWLHGRQVDAIGDAT